MKKFFKKLGLVLGVLIGLIIVVHIILNITFSIQLKNKIAELKREGKPTTIAEIIPPPVPDKENAAILYNKAFTLDEFNLSKFICAVQLESIQSRSKGKPFSDISDSNVRQRQQIQAFVNSRDGQNLYKLLKEGSQKPKCRFDLGYEKGGEMILPHLNSMRDAIKFLCLKALIEAEEGNVKGAFNTLLIGLKISNHLKDEPTLISQLVRIACDGIIVECIEGISNLKSIPIEEAKLIIDELFNHTDIEPFIKALDWERVGWGMFNFERILGRAMPFERSLSWETIPVEYYLPLKTRIYLFIRKPIIKKDFIFYLTLMSKVQDNYNLPYYKVAQEIKNNLIEKQIPRYCIFTRMFLPALVRAQENMEKHQANVEIYRAGLALKIYKIKNKAYPEELEDLVPDFLGKVPIDPFSGKELIYRKSRNWFKLYSFGPNMQDDGGISREEKIIASRPLQHSPEDYIELPDRRRLLKNQFNPADVKDYDIVWEYRE